jgi:peptidyl-tRNA hydrolase, PTH1 family
MFSCSRHIAVPHQLPLKPVSSLVSLPRRILSKTYGSMSSSRFLVVSHSVLNALQRLLGPSQPDFSPQRLGQKAARVSIGEKYLLAQCPTQMNVSGPWVAKAWQHLSGTYSSGLGLVLIHDDLEQAFGAVKTKAWTQSHRGQNGVKSVQNSLRRDHYKDYDGPEWSRILIGIGRPIERDTQAVSDYVLRPIAKDQKIILENEVTPKVLRTLLLLEQSSRTTRQSV